MKWTPWAVHSVRLVRPTKGETRGLLGKGQPSSPSGLHRRATTPELYGGSCRRDKWVVVFSRRHDRKGQSDASEEEEEKEGRARGGGPPPPPPIMWYADASLQEEEHEARLHGRVQDLCEGEEDEEDEDFTSDEEEDEDEQPVYMIRWQGGYVELTSHPLEEFVRGLDAAFYLLSSETESNEKWERGETAEEEDAEDELILKKHIFPLIKVVKKYLKKAEKSLRIVQEILEKVDGRFLEEALTLLRESALEGKDQLTFRYQRQKYHHEQQLYKSTAESGANPNAGELKRLNKEIKRLFHKIFFWWEISLIVGTFFWIFVGVPMFSRYFLGHNSSSAVTNKKHMGTKGLSLGAAVVGSIAGSLIHDSNNMKNSLQQQLGWIGEFWGTAQSIVSYWWTVERDVESLTPHHPLNPLALVRFVCRRINAWKKRLFLVTVGWVLAYMLSHKLQKERIKDKRKRERERRKAERRQREKEERLRQLEREREEKELSQNPNIDAATDSGSSTNDQQTTREQPLDSPTTKKTDEEEAEIQELVKIIEEEEEEEEEEEGEEEEETRKEEEEQERKAKEKDQYPAAEYFDKANRMWEGIVQSTDMLLNYLEHNKDVKEFLKEYGDQHELQSFIDADFHQCIRHCSALISSYNDLEESLAYKEEQSRLTRKYSSLELSAMDSEFHRDQLAGEGDDLATGSGDLDDHDGYGGGEGKDGAGGIIIVDREKGDIRLNSDEGSVYGGTHNSAHSLDIGEGGAAGSRLDGATTPRRSSLGQRLKKMVSFSNHGRGEEGLAEEGESSEAVANARKDKMREMYQFNNPEVEGEQELVLDSSEGEYEYGLEEDDAGGTYSAGYSFTEMEEIMDNI